MTGEQTFNGRCICGETFLRMAKKEYERNACRHIWENHRDQPPDKPLVIAFE